MKLRIARACASLAIAATTLVGGMTAAGAQPLGSSNVGMPNLGNNGCAANIIVSVPGGVNTTAGLPDFLPHGLYTSDVAAGLRDSTGGRVVDHYVSFNSFPGGLNSYQQIRQGGYNAARGLIARDAAACPHAKFSIFGYSLGADIASLLVQDIAQGKGPIPLDRLTSGVFLANPNRGVPGVEQRGGAPGNTSGAFGALPGGYGAATDRVVDICRQGDIVCDTPEQTGPLTKELAKTALLSLHNNVMPALDSFNRLSPLDKAVAVPALAIGVSNHTNYFAVNGSGLASSYIRDRLA